MQQELQVKTLLHYVAVFLPLMIYYWRR